MQEQIRFKAIRLRKAGWKYKVIEEILRVCYTTICAWHKKYEREDKKGTRSQKRGRKPGSCRTLNANQEKQIRKSIQDKCPDQLKLPFALWTRIAVQQLIRRLWSIEMPIRTVGEYLKRWDLLPKSLCEKPMNRIQKLWKNGLMNNILLFPKEPKTKMPKFNGVMKPVCAMTANMVGAIRLVANTGNSASNETWKDQSDLLGYQSGKNSLYEL